MCAGQRLTRARAQVSEEDLLAVHDERYILGLMAACDLVERGAFPALTLDPPYNDSSERRRARPPLSHAMRSASHRARVASRHAARCRLRRVGRGRGLDARGAQCLLCRPPARQPRRARRAHRALVRPAAPRCTSSETGWLTDNGSFLNNVALAAVHAKRVHRLQRIAIVDFSSRHGNGTQHLLQQDPTFTYISIHRENIFPFSGTANEHGAYANVLNLPVASRADFRAKVPALKVRSLAWSSRRCPCVTGERVCAANAGERAAAADHHLGRL